MDIVRDEAFSDDTGSNAFGACMGMMGATLGLLSMAKAVATPGNRTVLDNEAWSFDCDARPQYGEGVWVVYLCYRPDMGEHRELFPVVGVAVESHARAMAAMLQGMLTALRANESFLCEFEDAWNAEDGAPEAASD